MPVGSPQTQRAFATPSWLRCGVRGLTQKELVLRQLVFLVPIVFALGFLAFLPIELDQRDFVYIDGERHDARSEPARLAQFAAYTGYSFRPLDRCTSIYMSGGTLSEETLTERFDGCDLVFGAYPPALRDQPGSTNCRLMSGSKALGSVGNRFVAAFVDTIDDVRAAFDCDLILVADDVSAFRQENVQDRSFPFVENVASFERIVGWQLWRVANEGAGQLAYFLNDADGALIDSELPVGGISWGLAARPSLPRPTCPTQAEMLRSYDAFSTDEARRAWLRSLRDMGCT